jgi:hypothetical protein
MQAIFNGHSGFLLVYHGWQALPPGRRSSDKRHHQCQGDIDQQWEITHRSNPVYWVFIIKIITKEYMRPAV